MTRPKDHPANARARAENEYRSSFRALATIVMGSQVPELRAAFDRFRSAAITLAATRTYGAGDGSRAALRDDDRLMRVRRRREPGTAGAAPPVGGAMRPVTRCSRRDPLPVSRAGRQQKIAPAAVSDQQPMEVSP